MYKAFKILMLSAIFVSFLTIGAYAATGHEGMHEGMQHDAQNPGTMSSGSMPAGNDMSGDMRGNQGMHHENTMQHEQDSMANPNGGGHGGHSMSQSEMATMDNEGGHGGHSSSNSSANQGPDWPVIYGFGAVNLAVIATAALKRYVFKDRSEVKTNA